MTAFFIVAAGVIEKENKLLITRRPPEAHLSGFWEFPGGKKEEGESLTGCLLREIREELGIKVDIKEEILSARHDDPERSVQIHFFRCLWSGGEIISNGREFQWVERASLGSFSFPPANQLLIRQLTQ